MQSRALFGIVVIAALIGGVVGSAVSTVFLAGQPVLAQANNGQGQPMAAMTATPTADMAGMKMDQPQPTPTMATMQMGSDLPMDEPVPSEGVLPATERAGNQPLPFRLENGVKVFELTARPVKWTILDGVEVTAWSYNGTVPGPLIRVTEGDHVRIVLTNQLPDATSIHWHGLVVPNAQDGVAQPPLTQAPVEPGATFTYEFVAPPSGTIMYHSHVDTDTQINIGLFGAFIIDPKHEIDPPDQDITLILNEWRYDAAADLTYPAMPGMGEPNYFTVNGKAYPAIPTLNVKQGERVRIRLIGAGQFEHPMHLHGMPFKIVATDGNPVPKIAQLTKDTISVHPGERYDIEFTAFNPGQWAFHCHIVHHATNDDVEPGGLLFVVNVQ